MMKFEVTRPIATKSAHVRTLLKLAAPLIINNLAIASIHFADAVMAGRLGAETLAAVAVGSSVWMLGFTLCMGILMAVSPIVSRLYGAGDFASIGRYVRQAFWLSQMLAVFIFVAAFLFVRPVLTFIGIDPGFRDMTIGYVQAIMFGMPAMGLFLVSRFTTEGIGETRPIMYASLLSLACNVFGNWVFMYGNLGFPAMGAVGCGLASAISIWMMAFALGLHVLRGRRYRPLAILARFSLPRWQEIRELLGLGLPIAVTITAESGLFSAVAILTGTISAQIAAAHQIAINFAATMFMIPLALSSATTVLVGQSLGAGDYATARLRGWIGIGTSGVFMLTSAVFLVLFRTEVVDLYTNDVSVRDIAIGMLFMAAIFQVADGMQIGAAAALRGYKDAKVPMVINTFAYWVLAFPLAYLAA
ncbi:MAG: MATE family efflux transporter, partial [Gammaproteobacteria bacterium]|nr:MATE family efflux transporter [Gammaproteobacteria bacterium]